MYGRNRDSDWYLLIVLAAVTILISVFTLSSDVILRSIALIPFVLFIPGSLVASFIRRMGEFDAVERTLANFVIGSILTFIPMLALQELFDLAWDDYVKFLLAPLTIALAFLWWIWSQGRTALVLTMFRKLSNDFRSLGRTGKGLTVLTVLISMTLIITMIYTVSLVEKEGFSEFYVLNSAGESFDYPMNFTVGDPQPVILGISNHEGYAINYTVETWRIDYTLIDQVVNVTQMYFLNSFRMELANIDYDLNEPWVPQYETAADLNFTVTGDFKVLFILYAGESAYLPADPPLDPTVNYAQTEASWKVVQMVNREIQYLTLIVNVA